MKNRILLGVWLMSFTGNMVNAQTFNISGRVIDASGNPVANVVVNDGVRFTQTDSKGKWALKTDTAESKFVSISTPSDYELPQERGLATGFYVSMKEMVQKKSHDFVLKKRANRSNRFSYIAISDPQVRGKEDMKRWESETIEDLSNTIGRLKKNREVVGMTLGDLVFDNMQLFETYKASFQDLGMTVFQTIGNHDFDQQYEAMSRMPKGSKNYGEMVYEHYFGPVNYSFNIGKVHVITLKSIDYKGNYQYDERLTPVELNWLENDLRYVPKGSVVFLNMHATCWNTVDRGDNIQNPEVLSALLMGYDAHVFTGHTHVLQNYEPREGLYEHNVGAACGAWWAGWVNRCGAPNGYLVVDVDGIDVKWHYKSTGQADQYQMKVYKPGEFLTQKDRVVANVWDWDKACKVEWYQDGKPMGAMEQFPDMDQTYRAIVFNPNEVFNTEHLFRATPSASAKEIKIVFTNRFGEKYSETIDLRPTPGTRIIAHRGFWDTEGSAQNSIAALVNADRIGVYGSEFDVQRTGDKVAVVNHDDDIDGILIRKANYADIKDKKLKNGETLPTLAQYLEKGKQNKVAKMILEIKPMPSIDEEDECVNDVMRQVKASGYHDRIEYISFSQNICKRLAKYSYGAKVAYLGGDLSPQQVKDMGLTGIDYSHEVLKAHPEWIEQARQLGLTVNVWTVNKLEDIKYFLLKGVDYITTNAPVEAMELEKTL